MPNPKKKHTRHRTGIRRASNWKFTVDNYAPCPNCKKPKSPHRICAACGFYNGRLVIVTPAKKPKKDQQEGQ